MNGQDAQHLRRIADEAMLREGFLIAPPADAAEQARQARAPEESGLGGLRDLSGLPWSSIDEPTSRDLDQIEAVETVSGATKLYVGVADVDLFAPAGSALDRAAGTNTTSVYAGSKTYAMLPEQLSFGLSSLLPDQDRAALVVETAIGPSGETLHAEVYRARVRNKAKLDYPGVSAWLDGRGPKPAALSEPVIAAQVEAQDRLASVLRTARHRAGALDFQTAETRLLVDAAGEVRGIGARQKDRGGSLIEELMLASNRAVARWLDQKGAPSIRRIVRRPAHWDRIVSYAKERGSDLPPEPSSKALCGFLCRMRTERAADFSEISLAVIKMIGRGEYAPHRPGEPEIGHFGLAAEEYTHSSAPNRRYVDLVLQRTLKGGKPYAFEELARIAARCTERESAAAKVERRVHKAAAALLLKPYLGKVFDAMVTGKGDKGTFVRVESPWAEGLLVSGADGAQVGEKLKARLVEVNADKGYIDFAAV